MLSREAQEFNARQKRSSEYYDTTGRGLDRIETVLITIVKELSRLNINIEKLIQ